MPSDARQGALPIKHPCSAEPCSARGITDKVLCRAWLGTTEEGFNPTPHPHPFPSPYAASRGPHGAGIMGSSKLVNRPAVRSMALAAAVTLLLGLPVAAEVRHTPFPVAEGRGDLKAPATQRMRQTQPNFHAPAATICSDTPVLREVADPSPKPQQHNIAGGEARLRRGDGSRAEAKMMAPPSPPAPVAPSPDAAVAEAAADGSYAVAEMPMAPASSSTAVRQQQEVVTAGGSTTTPTSRPSSSSCKVTRKPTPSAVISACATACSWWMRRAGRFRMRRWR